MDAARRRVLLLFFVLFKNVACDARARDMCGVGVGGWGWIIKNVVARTTFAS